MSGCGLGLGLCQAGLPGDVAIFQDNLRDAAPCSRVRRLALCCVFFVVVLCGESLCSDGIPLPSAGGGYVGPVVDVLQLRNAPRRWSTLGDGLVKAYVGPWFGMQEPMLGTRSMSSSGAEGSPCWACGVWVFSGCQWRLIIRYLTCHVPVLLCAIEDVH